MININKFKFPKSENFESVLCLQSSFSLSLCKFFLCEKALKLSEILLKGAAVITEESVTDMGPAKQRDQRSGSLLSIIGFRH